MVDLLFTDLIQSIIGAMKLIEFKSTLPLS